MEGQYCLEEIFQHITYLDTNLFKSKVPDCMDLSRLQTTVETSKLTCVTRNTRTDNVIMKYA